MSLRSIALLSGLLLSGAAPALASGVQVTPGTVEAGFNYGYFSAVAVDYVGGQIVQDSVSQIYSGPVAYSDSVGSGGASATGSLIITNSPTPGILSSVTLSGGATGSAAATIYGVGNYSFQILGDAPTVQVRIDALGSIGFFGASYDPISNDEVSEVFRVVERNNALGLVVDEFLDLFNSRGVIIDGAYPGQVAPYSSLGFTIGGDFTLLTNTVYDVILQTRLTGTASGAPVTLFANIDPTFTVDGPFTFQVSPGFGGVSVRDAAGGVPEPSAWAMLLLGFYGVGTALRRRRAIPA